MSETLVHRLPVSAYTDPAWFAEEQRQIFSRTWAFAGFYEDVAEPGKPVVVQAGLNSIFVIRGDDGVLRAFHNICRHRGTELLRAVGQTEKVITCPYHDWTYDLEGRLISIPDEEEQFGSKVDKSCLALKPASVGIWRSMVFVHPDPAAGPVEDWFGPMDAYLGPHEVEALPEYKEGATSYEIKANWKIVVENFMDVYHLSHLHAGSLSMYDHARANFGFIGPHYAFEEPLSADFAEDLEGKTPYPLVVLAEAAKAWVPMLFPGIGLAETESSWGTFIVTPLAADFTRVTNRVRVADKPGHIFARQAARSARYWAKTLKSKYPAKDLPKGDPLGTGDVTAEDIYVCEQAQKALSSPHYEVGPASKGEAPVLDHQSVVLEWLKKPVAKTPEPPKPLDEKPKPPASKAMAASLTVELRGQTHEVHVEPNQTLLKAAKEAFIDPPFSCQAGICGTCKAVLLEGDIASGKTPALSDEEKATGHILACQARARSARLRLRFLGA